jgi:hypothetical protein
MNSSKYDDFSFLLPHLLGTNRLLFKTVLQFLARFIRQVPSRIGDVSKVRWLFILPNGEALLLNGVIQAIRAACDRQGTNPFSNLVEYVRLNNGSVTEDALFILLQAMEADPSCIPSVFGNSLMENVKPYLDSSFEPPKSLLQLQSFVIKSMWSSKLLLSVGNQKQNNKPTNQIQKNRASRFKRTPDRPKEQRR